MRVEVEVSRCIGSGACEMIAPEVFEIRDDMVCHLLVDELSADLLDDAEMAVEACPTNALRLV